MVRFCSRFCSRFLSIFFLISFFFLSGPSYSEAGGVLPEDFVDIQNHWAQTELTDMIQLEVLSGYSVNNKYYAKPNVRINRMEFAALLAKAMQLPAATSNPDFVDWNQIPEWARSSVGTLVQAGIINGMPDKYGNLYFQPYRYITRGEIAAMMVNALKIKPTAPFNQYFKDVYWSKWYAMSVYQADKAGLVGGVATNTFAPDRQATRGEVLVILNRFLKSDTSEAPTDSQLLAVVQAYQKAVYPVLAGSSSSSTLKTYIAAGAETALQAGGLGVWENIGIKGAIFWAYADQTPTVVSKSDRVALVRCRMVYHLESEKTVVQVKVTENYGLLREQGAWKIYKIELTDCQLL